MVLSCSSFGLPSESNADRLSDKEIMSELGKTSSPARGLQLKHHEEGKQEAGVADLDVSFDFLNEKHQDAKVINSRKQEE